MAKILSCKTADDAVFVDAHGPASKAEVVKHTSEFRLDDYTIDDVKFLQRDPVRLTENNSRQPYMSSLFGWTAKVSGSASSVRRPRPDNLEV